MRNRLLLLLTIISLGASAQNLINISPFSFPKPVPANTADWGSMPGLIVIANVAAQANTAVLEESKVAFTIKSGGSKVCGGNLMASEFAGKSRIFKASEISGMFNDFVLKPGSYQMCVQFFSVNYANGQIKPISDEKCSNTEFVIEGTSNGTGSPNTSYTPPQNISPSDQKVFSETEGKQPLTFRWTPCLPKPRFQVIYKLKVWQVMEGQNGTSAMKTNQPVIDEEVKDQTQYNYRKGWDGVVKGGSKISFVWNIEAVDAQGKVFGVSEATGFSINNQQQQDCCKGGFWGDKIIEGTTQIRCGITLPISMQCNTIKTVSYNYTCNSAAQCNAQIIYKIENATGSVMSTVTAASGVNAAVAIPATPGFYCLVAYAVCDNKICDSCKACFKVECSQQPQNCCIGSSWISKSINWSNIKDKVESIGAKTATETTSNQKTRVLANGGVVSQIPTSINISKCDSNYHLAQGGSFTFNADFQCVTGSSCTKKLFVKVKGIGNTWYDGMFAMPKTITFTNAGDFFIEYIAVCGTDTCARCPFTLTIDKNCCLGSHWSKAEYQIVNKNYDGSWDWGDRTFYSLPLTISTIPTYIADLGINIENLNFQCAAGCLAGYIIKRKNLTTGALVEPDETLTPGQISTSIYAKPFPQLITITPTCNGKVCGTPIIFKVECLHKDCLLPALPPCTSCDTAKNLLPKGNFESYSYYTGLDFYSDFHTASGLTDEPHNAWIKYGFGGTSPTYTDYTLENSDLSPTNKQYWALTSTSEGHEYHHDNYMAGKIFWRNTTPIPTTTSQKYSLCFKINEQSFLVGNFYHKIEPPAAYLATHATIPSSSPYYSPCGYWVGKPKLELEVLINGVLLTTVNYETSGTFYKTSNWKIINLTWTATSTNAIITFRFKNEDYPKRVGWQFALDDLTFKECTTSRILDNATSAQIDLLYPKSPCPIVETRPTFQWAEHAANILPSTKYQLKVVEVTKDDDGLENIDIKTAVVFIDNITADNIKLPKNNPALEPNKFYAWQVSKLENNKLEKSKIEVFSVLNENAPESVKSIGCCDGGLIANGGFVKETVSDTLGSGGSSSNWTKGYGNPIINFGTGTGCFDDGFVKMDGNITTGSCIQQVLNSTNKIKKGKRYKVSMAVKFEQAGNTLNYAKIRVVAFNGSLGTGTNHRIPNADLAIVGRSGKIVACDDWSVRVFTMWTANKDFDNIAVNVFTDDNTSSSISIDNISICEIQSSDCDALTLDANGNPVTPPGLQTATAANSCVTGDEDENYFNGSLTGLYGYDGTFAMYDNLNLDDCNNIEGPMPAEFTNYNCDDSLRAMGLNITCDSLQRLMASDMPSFTDTAFVPTPLPPFTSTDCGNNQVKFANDDLKVAFGGRDIIYIHGLQFSHILDKLLLDPRAIKPWPLNKSEFLPTGYYKTIAEANWKEHIKYFNNRTGRKNRYFIASYNCAERADIAIYNLFLQIKEAMEHGTGVENPDPTDKRGTACFGKEFVIISHSTGGLIANLVLSIANQTKTNMAVRAVYGDAGFISDRCKGHIALHGAMGGSNLAKICVLTRNPVILNSVLVDLTPEYTYARWGLDLSMVPKPVLTVSGGHPMAEAVAGVTIGAVPVLTFLGAPPTLIILAAAAGPHLLPGLDDGIVNMESSSGRNKPIFVPISKFFTPFPNKAFDLGIQLDRALASYFDQKVGIGKFSSAANPFLSPQGMLEPRFSARLTNPQFHNNYTFIQSASEHIQPSHSNYFDHITYHNSLIGSAYYEEQLVTNDSYLYSSGIVDSRIINEMGEDIRGKKKIFPWFKIVFKNGHIKVIRYGIEYYLWKRKYHNLQGDKYDDDFAYDYLFKQ
jgi:hypothetical protein